MASHSTSRPRLRIMHMIFADDSPLPVPEELLKDVYVRYG